MIRTFKHKGLRELFERGATRSVQQSQIGRCRGIMTALNEARHVQDMNQPGYRLHELKPYRPGVWAVRVNGPWRITFEFREGGAYNVDLEQYH